MLGYGDAGIHHMEVINDFLKSIHPMRGAFMMPEVQRDFPGFRRLLLAFRRDRKDSQNQEQHEKQILFHLVPPS